MFISGEELKPLSKDKIDIAIVGAGPAGISLAMELASKGISSLLLEAGGFEFPSQESNDPYVGKTGKRPYALSASRRRFFGGTSNHWGGWCRPLDREDLLANEGIPYSGWPITYDELAGYYDRSHDICEIPGKEYNPERLDVLKKIGQISFAKDAPFRTGIFRFSPPTRFGTRYRKNIEKSKHIQCCLNVSLLKVTRSDNGRSRLVVRTKSGAILIISCRFHVLAMGGIENARSLLVSNLVNSRPFGGRGDWIGRCFMDHYGLSPSIVLARKELTYEKVGTPDGGIMPRITPSPSYLRSLGVGNFMISLSPIDEDVTLAQDYGSNPGLFHGAESGAWHYSLLAVASHRPNRKSRVLLDDEKDIHGIPRIILDWQIQEEDFSQLLNSIRTFGSYLGATLQGRMKYIKMTSPEIGTMLSAGMHHMGTTRMAKSAEVGVVDSNCRVFDTTDLYVAGSSVFPTSGYANPTLTIVALAIRLAEHLTRESKRK